MIDRVWTWLLLLSVGFGLSAGRADEMAEALLMAGEDALGLMLTLASTMTLWSGLMEILSGTGDVLRFGRLLRRMAGPAFGGLRDEECWEAMSMNIAANVMGVGNASTPAGVRAAQLLAKRGEQGLAALAALLALNNAGLQAIPTTVITLRQAAGSADAAGIWGVSLAAAGVSALVSMVVLMLWRRRGAGGIGA